MTTLRVATINLRNRSDRWLERRHLLVSQLVDAAPDLVSLQEIYFPIGQGRWLRNQINNRISGSSKRPYQLIQRRKRHLINGYFEGIGILSRLPILYHSTLSLGYGGRIALRANIELPSRQTVDFVAVHLHHISHDKEARAEQVMQLAGWLNTQRRVTRQIIAGDFNEVPDGTAVQLMRQGYHSAFAKAWGHDPLATFPTALVPTDGWAACLDYIFLSPAISTVQDARIICQQPHSEDDTLYPSDHVGLLTELSI
ncbi:MAG: endonuclease/exonuclease/phosphatase family protein [Anaerolineales bacterium]|nr:endonuclease/exonuclease/phosphatase family protein [Anaerolineales bacterium]MCA9975463.1 endonuclease/exonuclease/phosphatase family protein [Anaerolineales bacterium]MCB8989107.1 endonuclease/exonuclease/phosphatase family protein [Ardenticatenaceae bacterium]